MEGEGRRLRHLEGERSRGSRRRISKTEEVEETKRMRREGR